MRGLTARQALRLLELDAGKPVTERALTLLRMALPDPPSEDLASLSIGARDAALLELRRATFGPTLECRADCPGCGEPLEFDLDVRSLVPDEADPPGSECELIDGDWTLRFRLPTVADLDAAAACNDVDEARSLLIESCVLAAKHAGTSAAIDDTPSEVLAALAERIAEVDPAEELRIELTCPACEHTWSELLEIASFLWDEVRAAAERTLLEVDALARAYGWREEDILSMSVQRRRLYVELVSR